MNSKWITELNIKHTTIKILQNLWDLTLGKEFLDMTPKAQSIKKNK